MKSLGLCCKSDFLLVAITFDREVKVAKVTEKMENKHYNNGDSVILGIVFTGK